MPSLKFKSSRAGMSKVPERVQGTSSESAFSSLASFCCSAGVSVGSSPRVVPQVLDAAESSPVSLIDGSTIETPARPSGGSDTWKKLNIVGQRQLFFQ